MRFEAVCKISVSFLVIVFKLCIFDNIELFHVFLNDCIRFRVCFTLFIMFCAWHVCFRFFKSFYDVSYVVIVFQCVHRVYMCFMTVCVCFRFCCWYV